MWVYHINRIKKPKRERGAAESLADGIYVDAKFRDGHAGLGCVVISGGQRIANHTRAIKTPGNNDAEIEAVLWAKRLYPDDSDLTVFSDNTQAAVGFGATWIPRERNILAHDMAAVAFRMEASETVSHSKKSLVDTVVLDTVGGGKKNKIKKKFFKRGRGVIPAEHIRRSF